MRSGQSKREFLQGSELNFSPTGRQIIGIDPISSEIGGDIRREQIDAIIGFTPWAVFTNILNAPIVACLVYPIASPQALFSWLAAIAVVVSGAMRGWLKRKRLSPKTSSHRTIKRAARSALLFGLIWAAVPALWLAPSQPANQIVIIAIVTGMICAGGFALATIPLGALAYVGAVCIGTFVGIAQSQNLQVEFLGMLLAIYAMIVAACVLNTAKLFHARFLAVAALTERRQVIELLLHDFEDNSADWLFECDTSGRLQRSSPRLSAVLDCSLAQLEGAPLGDWITHSDRQKFASALSLRAPFHDLEVEAILNGHRKWWQISANPIRDRSGVVVGFRGVGSDITEAKANADRMRFLAQFDHLTGMPNRMHFLDSTSILFSTQKPTGSEISLLCIDLDDFKSINDTLGHPAGDQLLKQVAERLKSFLGPHAICGRLGGDEFGVSLRVTDRAQIDVTAAQIIEELSRPYFLDGNRAVTGASVGVSFSATDGATVEELLRNADLALYQAKASGRGCAARYSEDLHQAADERRATHMDLMHALERQELELYYQPIVDSMTRETIAFEALLRWHHPVRGLLTPDAFVSIAETSGLIGQIGDWVIDEACRAASQWPPHIRVAVNLSPVQFDNKNLASTIALALAKNHLRPNRLEIEITEDIFMEINPNISQIILDIDHLGVRLVLDDFGVGYSSLGYITQLPFKKIKIDRSFVSGEGFREQREAIISAIATMARSLNMNTTAEGVETNLEFSWVRDLGCDQIQGYLIAKPLPLSQLSIYLKSPEKSSAVA